MAVDIWQEMAKESDENNSYLLQKEQKSTRTMKWPFGSSSKVLCTPIVPFGTLASAIRPLYKHLYHLFLGDMYDDSMVHVTWKFTYMNRNLPYLNPIQGRGDFVPPHLNHSISSKRLGLWRYCFVTFLSMYFPLRKVQFHQPPLMYVAMATMKPFIFENSNCQCLWSISTWERLFIG